MRNSQTVSLLLLSSAMALTTHAAFLSTPVKDAPKGAVLAIVLGALVLPSTALITSAMPE